MKKSLIAGAVAAFGLSVAPGQAYSCTCVATAAAGAKEISSLVAAGSTSIATALTLGFEGTSAQFQVSSAKSSKDIVGAIESLEKRLAQEVRKVPVASRAYEQDLNRLSPARHASNECEYVDRTGDLAAASALTELQESNLNAASYAYNEMTSSYPAGADPDARFAAQTRDLLANDDGIKLMGMSVVSSPSELGAMTPDELQSASTALNLMVNPSPPARSPEPSTVASLNANVKSELYNLRMSIPQAVSQAILSYEAPVMDMDSDSWFVAAMERLSPKAAEDFTAEGKEVSQSDLIRLMATHRVQDPSWAIDIAAKDKQGLLKDLAITKADHLAMDYELWKQDRYNALMMSQLLASQLRLER